MQQGDITQEGDAPEPGRPRLARSRRSDPGPQQEAETAKLSGNRRGVGWVRSTGETLEQSRAERWRRGRREGTQSEEAVDAEARPGHSAGFGVSQEAPIRGSNLNGSLKPRTSITSTSDKSPVRESRTPGSEGEVPGNRHLYPTEAVLFGVRRGWLEVFQVEVY